MTYSLSSSTIRHTLDSPSTGSDSTVHQHTVRSTRHLGSSRKDAATASSASALVTTLDCAPKSPLTPATIQAAQKVAKECSDIWFESDTERYYGVPPSGLNHLRRKDISKRTMLTAMKLLGAISDSCRNEGLRKVLSVLEKTYLKSLTRFFQSPTSTFRTHARRVIYRSIVCFQGYYDRNQHEIKTLDQRSAVPRGGGGGRKHDFWIDDLYSKRPDDCSALQYLKRQISKLPVLLDELMGKISESRSSRRQKETTTSGSFQSADLSHVSSVFPNCGGAMDRGITNPSKMSDTSELIESSLERHDSLVVQLKIQGWNNSCNILQGEVLRRLALDGVTKDANPDKGEDESENDDAEDVTGNDDVDALLEGLLCNRYIAQLPAHHRRYLLDELLRSLGSRSENPCYHLAMVLGYFDWSRESPSEEPTSLDDGELHDLLWNRGMALLSPVNPL